MKIYLPPEGRTDQGRLARQMQNSKTGHVKNPMRDHIVVTDRIQVSSLEYGSPARPTIHGEVDRT